MIMKVLATAIFGVGLALAGTALMIHDKDSFFAWAGCAVCLFCVIESVW